MCMCVCMCVCARSRSHGADIVECSDSKKKTQNIRWESNAHGATYTSVLTDWQINHTQTHTHTHTHTHVLYMYCTPVLTQACWLRLFYSTYLSVSRSVYFAAEYLLSHCEQTQLFSHQTFFGWVFIRENGKIGWEKEMIQQNWPPGCNQRRARKLR